MMNYLLNKYRRFNILGSIFSTIDSAGQAHQNGCDMTRNIPQPIWCIGPQKLYTFLRRPGESDVRFFFSCTRYTHAPYALHLFFYYSILTTLHSFHFFLSFLTTLRTDTILFIKAGCDSRQLYDKPTLMVKVCPVSRQDAVVLASFSTNISCWLPVCHVYRNLRAQGRGDQVFSLLLLQICVSYNIRYPF